MARMRALVVVPDGLSAAEAKQAARDLLDPFDMNLPVQPYDVECSCRNDSDDARPLADCPDCHGTGEYSRFGNPLGKWDYFSLSDAIPEQPVLVRDLPDDFRTFAVITPDGTWRDREGAGNPSSDEWRLLVREILRPFADCYSFTFALHQ